MILIYVYLGLLILRIFKFPGVKNIPWGWFILLPIFYGLARVIGPILAFIFYAAFGFTVVYFLAKLIVWVYAK